MNTRIIRSRFPRYIYICREQHNTSFKSAASSGIQRSGCAGACMRKASVKHHNITTSTTPTSHTHTHLVFGRAPKPHSPSPYQESTPHVLQLPPLLRRRQGLEQPRVLVGLHLLRELLGSGSLQSPPPPRQRPRSRPPVGFSEDRAHAGESQVATAAAAAAGMNGHVGKGRKANPKLRYDKVT